MVKMRNPPIFLKLFRCLVIGTTTAVALVAVLIAAINCGERNGNTSGIAFRIDVALHHLQAFPRAIRHRTTHCTYSDVWALSPPVDRAMAQESVENTFQIEKREGPVELVRTPAGEYWIPIRDIGELAETIAEQQSAIYEGVGAAVEPGDVALDCGANVGVYTRHALDHGARLVVAIEPAQESLDCLRRNVSKEISDGRVIVYPKGVWNKDDQLTLSVGPTFASSASSVAIDRGGKGSTVHLTTIDKLVAELHLHTVDFIKMDIEGAEMQALEGAVETVRRFHPRMAISTEHRTSDPDQIPQLVRKLWPSYIAQCGPCANVNGSIQPDVMFAHVL